nr:RHS repeat-associated core domain-containing protein [Treponema sp. OMZ 787]
MTHTDNQGENDEQKAKRYYYHSDHLGSAQFVTDWRGRQYEHIEYTPYGELWIEEVAAGLDKLPFRFTGKELDEETGLYYYGARYLDPKYSRWLSGDPALNDYIPKAPIDDEAKKHNENLPGMGGVFNTVNLHVYHYAGNNPVKYVDPDGRVAAQLSFKEILKFAVKKAAPKAAFAAADGPLPIAEIIIGIWTIYDIYQLAKTLTDEPGASRDIPEKDKDEIAQHALDGGHGPEINLDDPTKQGIKDKMDEVLNDPDTEVGIRRKDGAKAYLGSDGTLIIHNPSAEGKGTMFYDKNGETFKRDFQ